MTPLPMVVDDVLVLRPVHPRDAAEVFALVDRNREHLAPWMPWVPATRTVDDSHAFLADMAERVARSGAMHATLVATGRIVGIAGFHPGVGHERRGSLGYWLDARATGRGLMHRAVARLVRHGFEDLDLHRIEIEAALANRPSRRVAERAGFRLEGVRRQAAWVRGRPLDLAMYARLRDDPPR